MIKKNVILILFFFLSIFCYTQDDIKERDILSHNWIMDKNNSFKEIQIDSTTVSKSLYIETWGDNTGSISTFLPLLLDKEKQHDIIFDVTYKSENACEFYLKIVTFDEYEKVNSIDTLQFLVNKDWGTISKSINVKKAKFIEVFVEAKGGIQNDRNAKIWINRLDIFVNGESLHKHIRENNKTTPTLHANNIIRLNKENLMDLPFMGKKVLAIGESIHGTETFNKIAIDILKERITHQNCRFVLLEIPLEYSLFINRYIEGDSRFTLEKVSERFDHLLLSTSLLSFLEWIKEFNRFSDEKVFVFGIDVWPFEMIRYLDLFDFFYTLNSTEKSDEIKEMSTLLLKTRRGIDEVISMMDTIPIFKNILSSYEYKLIRHSMDLLSTKRNSMMHRDQLMSENIEFIQLNLVKENQNITLFCHFGHANYRNIVLRPTYMDQYSLGYYLKNQYGDDYSCIALIGDEGDFLTLNLSQSKKIKIEQLQPSPHISIESSLHRLNFETCYLPMDELEYEDVFKIRGIGNVTLEEQFHYICLKKRVDGVIFINSVAHINRDIDSLELNFIDNIKIMNLYFDALKKMGISH